MVDVLVIDEMGKEISGTGVDTKVVGRILMPLVSAEPEHARIPMTMASDREAIAAAVATVGLIPTDALKLMWIRNTAALEELEVSIGYSDALNARSDLQLVRAQPLPMAFDASGKLVARQN